MVELDFWQILTIVLSPIVIGAISTHILSRSWQKYQQKISMKRELINLYSESTSSLRTMQISLINEIANSVTGDIITTDELIEKGKVQAYIIFPNNPKEELQQKFLPQYLELRNNVTKAGIKRSLFKIHLKLYTDDEKIISDLDDITKNNLRHRTLIKNLINSNNSIEFKNNLDEINKLIEEYRTKSSIFSNKLVNMKIKNVIV